MGGEGIRVGSVLGAPVLLRPSWFVVVVVVTVAFAPQVTQQLPGSSLGEAYLISWAFALVLFASVFLHELSHALAARAVGSPPAFIVLDVWGGHTAFSAELVSPARSVLVAAAGPLTNVMLTAVGFGLRSQVAVTGATDLLLFAFTWSNGFVAAFNVLPGLPLDGGRILEGVVWAIRGDREAGTLAAGWGGRLVAVSVGAYAVLEPLRVGGRVGLFFAASLLAIAVLLWRGATQTLQLGRWRRRAPGVTVRALLHPVTVVPATATVADALVLARGGGAEDLVVVDGEGHPAAVLEASAASSVPAERAPAVGVDAVARALPPGAVVTDQLSGDQLVHRLQDAPHPEYAVVDASGTVVGLLRWRDVVARVTGR
jgi:Zn-dependent protease/CBS domain-containing protein